MKTAHDLVVAAKANVKEVSLDQAQEAILESDFLIDVRETEEYLMGHIPGALHISRGMLEFKMSADPALEARDNKIVLYCKTSGRAALCASALHEMGYVNVLSLAGGMDAWQNSGKPVARPNLPSTD